MSWNPETYNKFKNERFAPFFDLLSLVRGQPNMKIVDLGCGTGELTRKLADFLPGSEVLGIDSAPTMLKDARAFENEQVEFACRTIEDQLNLEIDFDLVFSNAAIQWVENHEMLMPKLISRVKSGGQLLIQLPSQHHNLTNKLLSQVAGEEPFKTYLKEVNSVSPVLEIELYAKKLFEGNCKSMNVFEKIYPLVLKDWQAIFEWVSGTALIPYLENLSKDLQDAFISEYQKCLAFHFPGLPVFYPFKRIIMEATW